jgi:hypothetical protein
MPLLDHFHEPLAHDLTWEELHAAWGPLIALTLNRNWLARAFIAKGHTHVGPEVEVYVATFHRLRHQSSSSRSRRGPVRPLRR